MPSHEQITASHRHRSVTELPQPHTDAWDWQLRARCRDADHELFFPGNERITTNSRRQVAEAKRLCRTCPVLAACRTYALHAGESYGIWGGMTTQERALHHHRHH